MKLASVLWGVFIAVLLFLVLAEVTRLADIVEQQTAIAAERRARIAEARAVSGADSVWVW